MELDILGVTYTLEAHSRLEDKKLRDCDGYCDKTSKRLVVTVQEDDSDLDNFEVYQRKCKRHEIIHAFLFESGLHENFRAPEWGHNETMIDWFAAMFPRLQKAFEAAGALD